MVARRKRFTREFKMEAVRLVTDSDQGVEDVAADLEIHPNTLYKWMSQYREPPEEAFPGNLKQLQGARELRKHKREILRLRMERDILKKSMSIFSKVPK